MATIQDYFYTDGENHIKLYMSQELTDKRDRLKIPVRMFLDFTSGSIYFSFYLSKVENPAQRSLDLVGGSTIQDLIKKCQVVTISASYPTSVPIDSKDLKFCGHIYIFTQKQISPRMKKFNYLSKVRN